MSAETSSEDFIISQPTSIESIPNYTQIKIVDPMKELADKAETDEQKLSASIQILTAKIDPTLEGVFRLAGNSDNADTLKNLHSNPKKLSETSYETHTNVAGLKRILKENPIFSREKLLELKGSLENKTPEEVYSALTEGLSPEKKAAFDAIFLKLQAVEKSKSSKMPTDNLAKTIGVTLFLSLSEEEADKSDPLGSLALHTEYGNFNKAVIDSLMKVQV